MKYVRAGLVLGVIALCVIAWTICAYLMGIHSPVKPAGSTPAFSTLWADVCAGEPGQEGRGCEKVIQSSYGTVKLPWRAEMTTEQRDAQGNITRTSKTEWVSFAVPVAQVGQSYYIFMLVWFLFTGTPRRENRWWQLLPLFLAVAAAVVSVFYIYIMAFMVHDWCKLCLLLHVIDVLLLTAMFILWPWRRMEVPPSPDQPESGARPQPARLSLGHAMATLACAAAFIAASFRHHHDQRQLADALGDKEFLRQQFVREQERIDFVLGAYQAAKPITIPRRHSEITLGAATAPHEMIIFSDLQCPACYTFETTLRDQILIHLWKGTMKYTFRHYPLCSECNPFAKNMHPQGCRAAFALEAARIVGGSEAFIKMHHQLLQKYMNIQNAGFDPASSYEKYAAEIGLDPAAFRAAFQGDEVRRVLEEDIRVARQIGATATPTIFVDGRKLASYPMQTNNPHFWQALAKEHAAAPAAPSQPASQ